MKQITKTKNDDNRQSQKKKKREKRKLFKCTTFFFTKKTYSLVIVGITIIGFNASCSTKCSYAPQWCSCSQGSWQEKLRKQKTKIKINNETEANYN